MYLSCLTDRELARIADQTDRLFASDLEMELAKRFVRMVRPANEQGAAAAIIRQIDGHLHTVHELASRDTKFDAPVSEIERLVRDLAALVEGDD